MGDSHRRPYRKPSDVRVMARAPVGAGTWPQWISAAVVLLGIGWVAVRGQLGTEYAGRDDIAAIQTRLAEVADTARENRLAREALAKATDRLTESVGVLLPQIAVLTAQVTDLRERLSRRRGDAQ